MSSPPSLLIGQSSSFLFKFLRVLISVCNASTKCESCPLSTRPLSSNASCATSDCGKLACGSMPLGPRQSPSSRSSNHGSTTHSPTTTTNRCLRETDNPASGKVHPRRLVFPVSQPAEPQNGGRLTLKAPSGSVRPWKSTLPASNSGSTSWRGRKRFPIRQFLFIKTHVIYVGTLRVNNLLQFMHRTSI